jgi:peroxiredoxin
MAHEELKARDNPVGAGDTAPEFVLKDQTRADWRLSDHVRRGDVVLCFFPMAFTGVCTREMKCVNDEINVWQGRGTQVVGISCDSFAVLKAWADSLHLKQTLLADMHRQVCRAYGFYWPELNVSSRGTVVIGASADGRGRVKWVQGREPGKAMEWAEVLEAIAS